VSYLFWHAKRNYFHICITKFLDSSAKSFFPYVLFKYFMFFPFVTKKKEIREIQKTHSAPLITAIGLNASRKVSDYRVPRAREGETKGKRWMYLPCATVLRSSDKFVVPSCCGQHQPVRIYEVRRFNSGALLQARWYIARMSLPWMCDKVTKNENIVVHINDFIERAWES